MMVRKNDADFVGERKDMQFILAVQIFSNFLEKCGIIWKNANRKSRVAIHTISHRLAI